MQRFPDVLDEVLRDAQQRVRVALRTRLVACDVQLPDAALFATSAQRAVIMIGGGALHAWSRKHVMCRARGGSPARSMHFVGVMPYATNSDLPARVRKVLPRHAQDIYRAAFNSAYQRYGAARESVAHRIAWAAIKRRYIKRTAAFWVARKDAA